MRSYPITVNVSDVLYERLRLVAEVMATPVEVLIMKRLEQSVHELAELPYDEQAELDAFAYLSDDTLRGIAREQMPHPQQDRMDILMTHNSQGTLTPEEHAELIRFVEQGERLTLRKAWAAGILMDRGQDIGISDFSAEDE